MIARRYSAEDIFYRTFTFWLLNFVIFLVVFFGSAAYSKLLAQNLLSPPFQIHTITSETRLSSWLESPEGAKRLPYDFALAIYTAQERDLALLDKKQIVEILKTRSFMAVGDPLGAARLLRFIDTLPHLGRVALPNTDPKWLVANPASDPIIRNGDRVISTGRANFVTVVLTQGKICRVRHVPGQSAWIYAKTCVQGEPTDYFRPVFWSAGSRFWISQPDGRVIQGESDRIRDTPSVEAAPGAWIWAPSSDSGFTDDFHLKMARLLADQGPAGDYIRPFLEEPYVPKEARPKAVKTTRSQWGSVGLIQTPTARMASDSELAVSISRSIPYRNTNIFVQVLPWMEFGFRYTDINNRSYATTGPLVSGQSYKDKSIDTKIRLWEETDNLPEFSVGLRDVAGTGLFSSEFIVANKRFGNFDISAGLAWGYLGTIGDITNPLSVFKDSYKTRRSNDVGVGGEFAGKTWFTGPAAVFGGVQWQSPWEHWILKAELDGNDYQREPLNNPLRQTSRVNVGATYALADWVDLNMGYERGDRFSVAMVLKSPMKKSPPLKVLDPTPVPIVVAPKYIQTPDAWIATSAEIESVTTWKISRVIQQGTTLGIYFYEVDGLYVAERAELIGRILHRASPKLVTEFELHLNHNGLRVNTLRINRANFVKERTELVSERQKNLKPSLEAREPVKEKTAGSADQSSSHVLTEEPRFKDLGIGRFTGGFSPSFQQHIGGPSGSYIYWLGISARGEWRVRESLWISGNLTRILHDNSEKFDTKGSSALPQVRTNLREYLKTSRNQIPNLQATHVGQITPLGDNHYYSFYGGLLEWMFSGVGTEYLYRPYQSRWAFGVDVNRVTQREFDQRFRTLDYQVTTGHVSTYWDTGWNNVLVTLRAGQYLAGDRGATLDLSREFGNGIRFGMFATRTNVSAEQFGEGSFDKGVYLRIPFDAVLPTRSNGGATFAWTPLVRDGGARLGRRFPLYDLTGHRGPRTLETGTLSGS